jgi:leucine dehydrogenase
LTDIFEDMGAAGASRMLMLRDAPTGLMAIIALDDLTLGTACGGIRTRPYGSVADALADAQKLASAMTLKCAIAGLNAGGGKTVVIEHAEMDRPAAFRRLGEFVEDLGGLYRCAGDLGTTAQDLSNVAATTRHCNTTGEAMGIATAQTVVSGIRAAAAARGIADLAKLSVAVQGCGLIGAAVARFLAAQGAKVTVADVDAALAQRIAVEIGGKTVAAGQFLSTDVDVLSPCAIGGTVNASNIAEIRAWAICGGANNQLADATLADMLASRNIIFIPDFLASSGAVIDGVCRTFMACEPACYLAAVEETAANVLREANDRGTSTVAIAQGIARSESLLRAPGGKRHDTLFAGMVSWRLP